MSKKEELVQAEVVETLPDANKTALMPITPNAADEFKNYDPAKELTSRQRLFCEYYASDKETRFNAIESYLKANPRVKRTGAASNVARLASDYKVRKYLRFLNLSTGFSDEMVDSKLKDHIFNSQERVSIQAIRHYNQLMGRITEKKQVTTVDANRLLDQLSANKPNSDYN